MTKYNKERLSRPLRTVVKSKVRHLIRHQTKHIGRESRSSAWAGLASTDRSQITGAYVAELVVILLDEQLTLNAFVTEW